MMAGIEFLDLDENYEVVSIPLEEYTRRRKERGERIREIIETTLSDGTVISTTLLPMPIDGECFETMVFSEGNVYEYQTRCNTYDDAVVMHERAVAIFTIINAFDKDYMKISKLLENAKREEEQKDDENFGDGQIPWGYTLKRKDGEADEVRVKFFDKDTEARKVRKEIEDGLTDDQRVDFQGIHKLRLLTLSEFDRLRNNEDVTL